MPRCPSLLYTAALSQTALLVSLHQAQAQPVIGPYVNVSGGGNLVQDERLHGDILAPNSTLSFDAGPAAVAGLGYGFGNGFRVQVEGDWRRNRLHSVSNLGAGVQAGGYQENYGGMADLIFDLDIGQRWIYPYFGAGVGYSQTRWRGLGAAGGFDTYLPRGFYADGSQGHFAFQGLFGLSFPLPYVPGLSFTAEYRFFSTVGSSSFPADAFQGFAVFGNRVGPHTDYNHTGLLGIRYALFTPAPPPSPTPAASTPVAVPEVAPSRTYLVFFDWDRAELTSRAAQIVAEAAQASTHVQTTRIEVNGYTDLSGSAAYNENLSVRRAQSVQAALLRDGVSQSEISIHGYGEANPLVQTASGIREPQNRRVEIILR